jgi:hypothetical protein
MDREPICRFFALAELSAFGVDESVLRRTGHPSGSRLSPKGAAPLPLSADQKIFGSRPCPSVFWYRSRGCKPTPRWLTVWVAKSPATGLFEHGVRLDIWVFPSAYA